MMVEYIIRKVNEKFLVQVRLNNVQIAIDITF